MRLRSEQILSLGLWLGVVLFCLWARYQLPDAPIATHFSVDGQPNGYMPRDVALAFGPALMLGFGLLLWVLPALSPKAASLKRSQSAFDAAQLAIIAFLTVVHIVVVLKALGVQMDIISILSLGTGFLFLIIGNLLPKTRFNYFMGVRTPWTLSDERVWDRTHRLAGPLFMLAGLATILAACLLPQSWQINVLLTSTLGAALIACVYSYLVSKTLR
ncbi:SdpI family protein [Asticcacaulis sp.]|uniref:SdpI family protein n=1 Tax=Asticcacaulis sp. TaxID=1872648 RepID=UPI003F7BB30C